MFLILIAQSERRIGAYSVAWHIRPSFNEFHTNPAKDGGIFVLCQSGGVGIHSGFKSRRRKADEFESRDWYQLCGWRSWSNAVSCNLTIRRFESDTAFQSSLTMREYANRQSGLVEGQVFSGSIPLSRTKSLCPRTLTGRCGIA